MKKLIQGLKNLWDYLKTITYVFLIHIPKDILNGLKKRPISTITTISIVGFLISFLFIPQLSTIPFGVIKVLIGIGMFYLIDKYILIGIDTIKEIKKGNIAYAILLLGYAVLVGFALLNT